MKRHSLAIIPFLVLTAGQSHAAVTLLNSVNFTDNVTKAVASFEYTTAFDPNDAADALVLIFATESASPTASVSFGGVAMTYAEGLLGNNPVGVYYLNSPLITSQTVSVTITRSTGTGINGIGFTIMALGTTGDLGITPTATATDNVSPLDIDITVPTAGSFVVAGFNSSSSTGATTTGSGLTSLDSGDFGSLLGAFGYAEGVSAGTQTYGFNSAGTPSLSAAVAFNVVPEPSAAMLGFSGLCLLLRRRRS